jgi:hypothetical protein
LLLLLQHLSKKVILAREVVRDVVGLSPYEKRILDIIKSGGTGAEKKVYKFAKNRVSKRTRAHGRWSRELCSCWIVMGRCTSRSVWSGGWGICSGRVDRS